MPLSLPSLPDKDTNDANADVEAAQWEMTMTRENGPFFLITTNKQNCEIMEIKKKISKKGTYSSHPR